MAKWPADNQASLIAFYGQPGAAVSSQLVKVVPPFRMTYAGKPVPYLMFHQLAAPALQRALKTVWDYYGHDQGKIDALGISKTAGTYNHRTISGSTKWSNHAYGAAIDINAEQNGFNMVGNIPPVMIAAFKAQGARWGGDYKGRTDPMHFEFCASGEPERTFEQWLAVYGVKPGAPTTAAPAPPRPKGITDDMRQRMMKIIMGYEGKIPPAVFIAPDGRPEIAGITQKDHPQTYARLKGLIDLGLTDKLQAEVIKYYLDYTAPAQNWTDRAGLEFFLRDCILNRGQVGAAEILQMALGLEVDFQIGPTTRGALAALDANVAIDKLRAARERYEEKKYGKQFRVERGQWQGLVNRWNRAQAHAKAFQKESPSRGAGTAGVIVVGGGAVIANEARELDTSWGDVALQFGALIVIAAAVFLVVRKIREAR